MPHATKAYRPGPTRNRFPRKCNASVARATRTYWPSTQAKIKGATMVASLSTINLGVF